MKNLKFNDETVDAFKKPVASSSKFKTGDVFYIKDWDRIGVVPAIGNFSNGYYLELVIDVLEGIYSRKYHYMVFSEDKLTKIGEL